MTAFGRVSVVHTVKINQVLDASIVELGDHKEASLFNRSIALQRAIPKFDGDESRFAAYRIFSLPLPPLPFEPDVLTVDNTDAGPIRVGLFRSLLVDASSFVRVGCGSSVTAESRIKHIRQDNRTFD